MDNLPLHHLVYYSFAVELRKPRPVTRVHGENFFVIVGGSRLAK